MDGNDRNVLDVRRERALQSLYLSLGMFLYGLSAILTPMPFVPMIYGLLCAIWGTWLTAHGSTKVYQWMITRPRIGHPVRNFLDHGLSWRERRFMVWWVALAIGLCVFFDASRWLLISYALALIPIMLLPGERKRP